MIRFRNVSKIYPRTGAAVSGITFRIRKAEFAFMTGHSGAGKSTVLRLIHFQTRPSEGQVQVSRYHSDRVKRREIPALRRRVGFVFQDFKLLERLTAAENVAFALKVTGTPRRDIEGKIQRLLSQVGLAAKARSLPSELSGGERQRIVIARALATDPLVLLADEPTGNLDPRAAQGVLDLFLRLNQMGMAVLMATHDAEIVRQNPAIRVLELEHGKLVFDSAARGAGPPGSPQTEGTEQAEGTAQSGGSARSDGSSQTDGSTSGDGTTVASPGAKGVETTSGPEPGSPPSVVAPAEASTTREDVR